MQGEEKRDDAKQAHFKQVERDTVVCLSCESNFTQ